MAAINYMQAKSLHDLKVWVVEARKARRKVREEVEDLEAQLDHARLRARERSEVVTGIEAEIKRRIERGDR
jgi:hypothetical protein